MLLLKLVLPVSMVALVAWAHYRISRALRTRTELPTDLKAKMQALEHQVAEFDESLKRHQAIDAGRQTKKRKAAEAAAPMQYEETPETLPPTVPGEVWDAAVQPMRDSWLQAGYQREVS